MPPTASPTATLTGHTEPLKDRKCPWKGGQRVFKVDIATVDECADLCRTREGCTHFTYAYDKSLLKTSEKNNCFGCKSDQTEYHKGFGSFALSQPLL